MTARLREPGNGRLFTLEDFNLIGRSHDATIRVEDAGISRQHATIRREGKLFWLTDLGSANGSYVNDVAVSTARVLRTGDRIQFGTSLFIFDHEDGDTTREITGANQTQMLSTVSLPVKTIAITLLVGDLRDFTKISAQLSAEEVAAMLREWYADCEAILKPRGAIIDKFMGDGVFAYWPQVDHATRERATESAKLLCRAVGSHSPTRKRLQDNMGINVQCNVGLNIGEVALGAMGRGVNTAVGEAVNVTFRIESLTRKLDTPVLASAAFVHGWPQAASHYTHAGIHPVKGQPDPVEVYSLIGA